MQLWRISNYKTLDGVGGLKASGRWHLKGHPVVYLSETPALALLEVMVHSELEAGMIPDSYQLLKAEVHANTFQSIQSALPDDWQNDVKTTQTLGTQWLKSGESPLLKVPSVILPNSYNYLLNPSMNLNNSAVSILEAERFQLDRRLLASVLNKD